MRRSDRSEDKEVDERKTAKNREANHDLEEEANDTEAVKVFFACYLLCSLSPRHKAHTYIGFTVNPQRRIKQHNGEKTCGAWRTKRGRPWEMALCIYGFPSNVSALQFEWAWQHPTESLAVRKAASSFKSFSGVGNKIKLAYTMLNLPSWANLNLTVNFFSTKYTKHIAGCPRLPNRMRISVCAMDDFPCYAGEYLQCGNDNYEEVDEEEDINDGINLPSSDAMIERVDINISMVGDTPYFNSTHCLKSAHYNGLQPLFDTEEPPKFSKSVKPSYDWNLSYEFDDLFQSPKEDINNEINLPSSDAMIEGVDINISMVRDTPFFNSTHSLKSAHYNGLRPLFDTEEPPTFSNSLKPSYDGNVSYEFDDLFQSPKGVIECRTSNSLSPSSCNEDGMQPVGKEGMINRFLSPEVDVINLCTPCTGILGSKTKRALFDSVIIDLTDSPAMVIQL